MNTTVRCASCGERSPECRCDCCKPEQGLVDLLVSELGQTGPYSWQQAYDSASGRRWLADRLARHIEAYFARSVS